MNSCIISGAQFWLNSPNSSPDSRDEAIEAILVQNGRLKIAGSLSECTSHDALAVVHDLGGGFVMPGFNDNHLHTAVFGRQLGVLSLRGLNQQQIIEALRSRFAHAPRGSLIEAVGWDYDCVQHPHAALLDEAFPHNPVILVQFSGHAAWVNSLVLRTLKIRQGTPDPPGGIILRDGEGVPTGVVQDAAVEPLHRKSFVQQHLRRAVLRRDIHAALEQFASMGLTSVQDNTWLPQAVWELQRLRKAGRLTCRFTCWPHAGFPKVTFAMEHVRYTKDWIELGPRKYFLDGTFSTRTAMVSEPYNNDPGNTGVAVMTREEIAVALRKAARSRRQAAFHAIGDGAITAFLDVFESVAAQYPVLKELRIRLEHVQLINRSDIARMKTLGVAAAVQPHAVSDHGKDVLLLGRERALSAYPYRSLLDAGVALSFGSDIPGEATVRPLLGIQQAVCHPGSQGVTAGEAMQAYTSGSAFAEFKENSKGRLLPGYMADMVHLSDDPRSVPAERIGRIRVLGTILAGRWVYRYPCTHE